MKAKFFIVILMGLVFNINVIAQKEHGEKINQLNSQGQKEGLWKDTIHGRIVEAYFKDGIESGIYKRYDPEGKLQIFGEYCEGKMCGTWYFFENTGHLWFMFKDFAINTNSIIHEGNGKRYVPDYKCYFVSYYPTGSIKDEGLLLWPEGETPESDMSIEYGEWKYYDETGKLIDTKNFK